MNKRIRRTKMHAAIIAQANELGYFPTLEQADAIWAQWDLFMAEWRVKNPRSGRLMDKELDDRSMRESIDKVLGK
jgi:hypothetical protein